MTDAIFISDDLVNDGIEHLRGDEIGLKAHFNQNWGELAEEKNNLVSTPS